MLMAWLGKPNLDLRGYPEFIFEGKRNDNYSFWYDVIVRVQVLEMPNETYVVILTVTNRIFGTYLFSHPIN